MHPDIAYSYNGHTFEARLRGVVLAEIVRGRTGWWVVTDRGFGRFLTYDAARARVERAAAWVK